MRLSSTHMLWPDGQLAPGWVRVDGGIITEVARTPELPPVGPGSVHTAYLAPGLVDIHCHGGGGATFATTDPQEARAAAAMHHRHGSTSVIASLVTASAADLLAQVATLVPLAREGLVAGIHLEGPWLSPLHRGAHDPELLRAPEMSEVEALLEAAQGHLRMVTLAPELPAAGEVLDRLVRAGVSVAIGHTDADATQTAAAIAAGARVVTHLCNAMRPVHHRAPGPIPTALADPGVTVELIVDGVHVDPLVLGLLARGARARVALVTDAMAAAGCADGRYLLGTLPVEVVDGIARLVPEDGSRTPGAIAGSTLTLDRAVRNAVRLVDGMSPDTALDAATRVPAAALGLSAGTIEVGRRADLVLLDEQLTPVQVWRGSPVS